MYKPCGIVCPYRPKINEIENDDVTSEEYYYDEDDSDVDYEVVDYKLWKKFDCTYNLYCNSNKVVLYIVKNCNLLLFYNKNTIFILLLFFIFYFYHYFPLYYVVLLFNIPFLLFIPLYILYRYVLF